MLPDLLGGIKQSIDEGIGAIEARLSGTSEQLRELLADIERERNKIQANVEERELDRILSSELPRPRGAGTTELRRQEDVLSQEYSRVSVLYRQLTDFAHLITASRQQFRAEGELPGITDAQRLAIRQAMIRAQEDERRRLAREIHDGPAQVLANAIIGLEFVERSLRQILPEEAQPSVAEIERVKAAMREGLTEIRRFIFDLRPTMLSQRGLAGTVEHYIETYRRIFSTDVHLSIPKPLPRLLPDQESTAFRIIQESLQNARRHARSTRVEVSIAANSDALTVRVRDNGQGFRPSAVATTPSGGFGLAGMRERAEVIGGHLTVRSGTGKGTDVILHIPLASTDWETVADTSLDAGIPDEPAKGECGT